MDAILWKRYKKTFVIPEAPNPNKEVKTIDMKWKLGRIPDTMDDNTPGADYRNTSAATFRYFTGLRIESGLVVNDTNYINLSINIFQNLK